VYNNPAFHLYRMATHPAYRLGWKTGERNLLLISMGTGMADTIDSNSTSNIAANLAGLPSAIAVLSGAVQTGHILSIRLIIS